MILLKELRKFNNPFNRINVFHRGYGAKICLPHVFQRLPGGYGAKNRLARERFFFLPAACNPHQDTSLRQLAKLCNQPRRQLQTLLLPSTKSNTSQHLLLTSKASLPLLHCLHNLLVATFLEVCNFEKGILALQSSSVWGWRE